MMRSKSLQTGWPVILLLSFLPIFLWFLAPSPVGRFDTAVHFFASLGQVLALCGISMFALNFILSARLKFLEKYFNGINRMYDRHSQLGQIALIFLLFHPLFLLPKYSGGSFRTGALFLLPNGNLAQTLGWLGLFTMLALIVLTLYVRPKYNLWKWTHKFLGVAFLLGALHAYLIPSDVAVFLPLRVYILGLSFLALAAFCYRSLFSRLFVKTYPYIVTSVTPLNSQVVEISLRPVGKPLFFEPGQFIFVRFKDEKISGEVHPFSLSSDPNNTTVTLTIKSLGDYTSDLKNLRPGSHAKLEGPFGVFNFKRGFFKDQIWIAGGIGITPFLSMASILREEKDYHVDLYYCVNNESEAIHLNELKSIAPNLHLITHYSSKEKFLDTSKIIEEFGPLKDKDVYICAPPPMIHAFKRQFKLAGLNPNFIFSEEFNLEN